MSVSESLTSQTVFKKVVMVPAIAIASDRLITYQKCEGKSMGIHSILRTYDRIVAKEEAKKSWLESVGRKREYRRLSFLYYRVGKRAEIIFLKTNIAKYKLIHLKLKFFIYLAPYCIYLLFISFENFYLLNFAIETD